jgi:sterol 3beta-glucosyltransferase
MSPQPWYPTKCFPHPLSNMGFASNWSLKNRLSYRVVDEFMWLGLGSIINDFRKKVRSCSTSLFPFPPRL